MVCNVIVITSSSDSDNLYVYGVLSPKHIYIRDTAHRPIHGYESSKTYCTQPTMEWHNEINKLDFSNPETAFQGRVSTPRHDIHDIQVNAFFLSP